MSHDLHTLLAIAVFSGCFYLATQISKPSAAQHIADAFHQIPLAPAICTGRRWLENLPAHGSIEDRRDPIAVLIGNN